MDNEDLCACEDDRNSSLAEDAATLVALHRNVQVKEAELERARRELSDFTGHFSERFN